MPSQYPLDSIKKRASLVVLPKQPICLVRQSNPFRHLFHFMEEVMPSASKKIQHNCAVPYTHMYRRLRNGAQSGNCSTVPHLPFATRKQKREKIGPCRCKLKLILPVLSSCFKNIIGNKSAPQLRKKYVAPSFTRPNLPGKPSVSWPKTQMWAVQIRLFRGSRVNSRLYFGK